MILRKCLLECRDKTLDFYQNLRSIWLLSSIMLSLLVILFIIIKVKGLSLDDILKRGNWSYKSTWQKHHKFVSNESAQFQKSVALSSL